MKVTTAQRSAGDPDRHLGLSGCPNLRDAGGYATRDGGRLRWRRLFRSGHLAHLSEAELAAIEDLSLDLVVDLRREDEQRREPSRLPGNVDVLSAEITPGSQASAIYSNSRAIDDGEAMFAFMCDINREFVVSQSDRFRAVFAELLEHGAERVLFHCSAGKDRTGFSIAMLHLALEVPPEALREDYLLSSRYYDPAVELPRARRKYPLDHLEDAHLMPMLRVEDAYLDAALAAIAELYGSEEEYLGEGLGLDAAARAELRRRFRQDGDAGPEEA
jgi:protein-tyrosine phosphatase